MLEHDLFRKPVPTFRDHALVALHLRRRWRRPRAVAGPEEAGSGSGQSPDPPWYFATWIAGAILALGTGSRNQPIRPAGEAAAVLRDRPSPVHRHHARDQWP